MEYLVIADFKANEGMAEDMANVFKEALVDTTLTVTLKPFDIKASARGGPSPVPDNNHI